MEKKSRHIRFFVSLSFWLNVFLSEFSPLISADDKQVSSVLHPVDPTMMITIPQKTGFFAVTIVERQIAQDMGYDTTTVAIHGIALCNNSAKIVVKKSYFWHQIKSMASAGPLFVRYDKAPKDTVFFICATAYDSITEKVVPVNVHDYITIDSKTQQPSYEKASYFFNFHNRPAYTPQEIARACLPWSLLSLTIISPCIKMVSTWHNGKKRKVNKNNNICPQNFIKNFTSRPYGEVMGSTERMLAQLYQFSPIPCCVSLTKTEIINILNGIDNRTCAIICAAPLPPRDAKPLEQEHIATLSERMRLYFEHRGLPFTHAVGHYNKGIIPHSYIVIGIDESEITALAQLFWQHSVIFCNGPQARLVNVREQKYYQATAWKECTVNSDDNGTVITTNDGGLFKFSYLFDQ